jgi:hypothetical protein
LIMENKVRLEFTHQSQIARITMNAPKANILDRAMMLSLAATFEELTAQSNVKAIVLAGTSQHFSFRATIEEHLPDQISDTLADLRQLLLKMMRAAAPLIAGSLPSQQWPRGARFLSVQAQEQDRQHTQDCSRGCHDLGSNAADAGLARGSLE